LGKEGQSRELKELANEYAYHGEESCATDGLCALDCPVGINTGKLMKELRYEKKSKFSLTVASFIANNFGKAVSIVRFALSIVYIVQKILPVSVMKGIGTFLHKASNRAIPLWNEFMPQAAPKVRQKVEVQQRLQPSLIISQQVEPVQIQSDEEQPDLKQENHLSIKPKIEEQKGTKTNGDASLLKQSSSLLPQGEEQGRRERGKVVYFPACINRMFGISKDYDEKVAIIEKTEAVIRKAGYDIIYPNALYNLCCGMAFDSKGFKEQGYNKLKELEAALLKASENGAIPVLCDMSPCLLRMKELMDKRLKLYEPVEFTLTYLAERLVFKKLPISVTVHSTCSTTKMGLENQLVLLADMCAIKVVKPEKTSCCGWAGDKGFNLPELNKSALKYLKEELPEGLEGGYSNSRTCEIGLTQHSGVSYKSIMYLVDKATEAIN